jgi:ribosome assembly protein 1
VQKKGSKQRTDKFYFQFQDDQISALERDESDDSFLYFVPEKGNVIFGSAIDGWGFTIRDFAEIYSPKLKISVDELQSTMWQDFYYSTKKKSCEKGAYEKGKKPLFVQFILDNVWNIYQTIDERNVEKVQGNFRNFFQVPSIHNSFHPQLLLKSLASR